MSEHKPSGSKLPSQNGDPPRATNKPQASGKTAAAPAKTPELPADSALPPDKLNAANDE